jgi:biotin carboxyl carrier protein
MTENNKLGYLNIDSSLFQTRLSSKYSSRKPYQPANPKVILSFIPGTIIDIFIKEGEEVKKGDDLMILDAMKMQNRLICTMEGKVKYVPVKIGDRVSKGAVLLELE